MNTSVIIICLLGGVLAVGMFFSYITGTGKSFHSQSEAMSVNATHVKEQQRRSIEDAKLKQQQYMEDMKQRISDSRR